MNNTKNLHSKVGAKDVGKLLETTLVAVSDITALHAINDQEKLTVLTDSMRVNGWQGRPLVLHQDDNGGVPHYQAWTGSHRLRAAVAAGVAEIPCYVISIEEYAIATESTGWNSRYDQPYDTDMITPDFREVGFAVVADLLEQN